MYGDIDNNGQLVAELDSQLKNLDWEIERVQIEADSRIRALTEKRAQLALRADAIRPSVINFIQPEGDRQRLHRALNAVRKATGAKGIALDHTTKYSGDLLNGCAYISYPIGDGLSEQIVAALSAEGLAVQPPESEWRAIVVMPTFERITYDKAWWDAEGSRLPNDEYRIVVRKERY